ncbi:MAG: phosphoglycolate phosphatase [Candidatus Eisenbacteria bacterium]
MGASRFAAVLFDLDGTLVETRRDIATGLNLVLAERGLPQLPVEQVAKHVGRGGRVLVARCLEDAGLRDAGPEEVEAAFQSFRRHYLEHALDTTRPFDGIPEMLARLREAGCRLAVVTNKPDESARVVIEGVGLGWAFEVIVGGESLTARKPDPAPLFFALEKLGLSGRPAVMVGDSTVDVAAGKAADGCAVAAVTWGYGSRESLEASGPDLLADDPAALADWILEPLKR